MLAALRMTEGDERLKVGRTVVAQELLRLHNAQVRRDGRIILDVDDFVIEEGERVVVLGPNGGGKSTLVKLLTREMMPLWREEPPVLFRGNPRAELREIQRTVGVVSTSFAEALTANRKVLDVVLGGFFGTIGVPYHIQVTPQQVEQAHASLRELRIDEFADQMLGKLSTGQQRRALVARALINAPAVLAFDEPCIGLDPEAQWNLRQSLSSLGQAGRTLLMVTHDVADIMPEFNRVVFLKDARIVADGPKEELLTTSNLRELFGVPVTLVEDNGRYTLY